jgi:hypothetical protein
MILALRQRHRRIFTSLAVLLPLAFAIGIFARKPVPAMAVLPNELTDSAKPFEWTEWKNDSVFQKVPVLFKLLREHKDAGQWAIALSATNDFVKPDLLVYWIAGKANVTEVLPDNAVLLGTFTSGIFPLPPTVASTDGALALYSLADQEIADVSKPIEFPRE